MINKGYGKKKKKKKKKELHKFAYFVLVMKNFKEGSVWYQLKEYISPSLFFCFKSLLYIH